MSDIKKRVHRHMFWIGLVSLILMLIDNITLSYFDMDLSTKLNQIEQTICIILSILLFLGILTNHTDRGVKLSGKIDDKNSR
ncbi:MULTISPECIES: phage holin [Streptococcus]|uniref:Phi LC3 family holin n=1 Tax=Streptococcus gallinaceus TaxID=165758 RepID=A0ABV2JKN2_9STRE|nr:phage holin [Streptococcus gallinaceus]MCP1639223.1 phi LC3 family holin [Streptococcus gallinaceus]MCP1770133.1 phi LC3 family holin [Streptococcus gallinaceus]